MEYNTNQELYQYFTHEIERIGEQQIEALRKEMDEKKKSELKRISDNIERKTKKYLNRELKNLNTDFSSEINRIHTENHRKLMEKRENLLETIFDDVRKKLADFVKSDDYKTLLEKTVKETVDYLGTESLTFTVGEEDEGVKNVLKETLSSKYEVKTSKTITIGGFKVKSESKGLEIDRTLDKKLKDQRDWFHANSGLFIRT
ncbi:MAG: V-type ATP synthase subunit E [Bacillota bacterium]